MKMGRGSLAERQVGLAIERRSLHLRPWGWKR